MNSKLNARVALPYQHRALCVASSIISDKELATCCNWLALAAPRDCLA